MKILIDTFKKTIEIQEDISVLDLFEELKKMLPEEDMKDYTIINSKSNNYIYYPINVPINEPYRLRPWWDEPYITYNRYNTTDKANQS